MSNPIEVRIKLPHLIHKKWQHAAELRGLTLKAFISATVSAELIRTGEIELAPKGGEKVESITPARKVDHAAVADVWEDGEDGEEEYWPDDDK